MEKCKDWVKQGWEEIREVYGLYGAGFERDKLEWSEQGLIEISWNEVSRV